MSFMIIFIYLKVQVLVRMIIFIACGSRKSNLSGSLGSFIHDEHRISPIFLFDAFFLDTILQDCISPVKRQCLNDEQRIRPFLGFRTDGDLPSLELSHCKINSQKNTLHVFWVWLFDSQGAWNYFYITSITQDCISPLKRQWLNNEQRIRPFLG